VELAFAFIGDRYGRRGEERGALVERPRSWRQLAGEDGRSFRGGENERGGGRVSYVSGEGREWAWWRRHRVTFPGRAGQGRGGGSHGGRTEGGGGGALACI